jgi:hypothetical protein
MGRKFSLHFHLGRRRPHPGLGTDKKRQKRGEAHKGGNTGFLETERHG